MHLEAEELMSQFMLLEFDNDELAAKFMTQLETKTTIHVRGLFQKPRTHCKCPEMSDTEMRGQITRGQKFGWWVHRTCGRAHGRFQTPRNLLYPLGTHPRDVDTYLHLDNTEDARQWPMSTKVK